jgi:thioredoxin 1
MMHPILEELHEKVGDKATIVKIDIDKNQELAAQYRVQSVPTLMIFKNGELKWRDSGARHAADLERELEKYY